MKRPVILLICMLVVIAVPALCYGGGKAERSKSGNGSSIGTTARSHFVKTYVKKDGTVVRGHRKTNPNKTKLDNYGNR